MSSTAGIAASSVLSFADDKRFVSYVPFRVLTGGDQSHWFGYYDKHQFDVSDRYVLGMETGFDNRSPKPDDAIKIGMIDLNEDNRWIDLSETTAWCWQQGCMLQWIPNRDDRVIYNDRSADGYCSVILNVKTKEKQVVPFPVYAVSPDGKTAVSLNFKRLGVTRPGYGYNGMPDPFEDQNHPTDDGIYRVDLESGKHDLVISLDRIKRLDGDETMEGAKHWFNHLLFNPDGSRFIFLHRWRKIVNGRSSWYTRMFTAQPDGGEIRCIADHEMVSHFIWRDEKHILAWSREPDTGDEFHLYEDGSDKVEVVCGDLLDRDGHCTYSPDAKWILVDTYPDQERMQELRLIRPDGSELVPLGRFYLPPDFQGEIRCDLHPRWSRDGKTVCIDSLHSGARQMYVLDVSRYV